MKIRNWIVASTLLLAGCASVPPPPAVPVEVQILAINDFHGNLEPPKLAVDATAPDGSAVKVPAGGVAYLASAAKALRAGKPYTVMVSAGDLIGAAPLTSALFLNEPTIDAANLAGLEFNAVGNHEFDKGAAELLRMQEGGCTKYTTKTPCALEPFKGARFKFLAANVVTPHGGTLFPGTAIKDFGPVQIGFIGMTLKETATLVSPAGVEGLAFADEAETANAAVPGLKAAGADAIVLLIHQGGQTSGGYNDKSCPNLDGDILPILQKLDPAIDAVISGHTHSAYICELPRSGGHPLLLTSAGKYGTLITDIRLAVDPVRGVFRQRADNIIIQSEPYVGSAGPVALQPAFTVYSKDRATAALIDRYATAASPVAARVIGHLGAPLIRKSTEWGEIIAGDFISDAQLAATRHLGAQIALTNSGGVRAEIVPPADGAITYGQLFAMQPFGNNLVVKTLTGTQLKALLEQQFDSGTNTVAKPNMLLPSKGFEFAYDLSRPPGQRIVEMKLDGKGIDSAANYRVTVVHFLSSGGDNFTVLTQGTNVVDAGVDIDATVAYFKAGAEIPKMGRIVDRTPK